MATANRPVVFKANIVKITRIAGKPEAQMVIAIPVAMSADIMMGEVKLTIETTQKSML